MNQGFLRQTLIALPALVMFFTSCGNSKQSVSFKVKNNLEFDREEIIAIQMSNIQSIADQFGDSNLVIKDEATGQSMVRQLVDFDSDGISDEIIFQVVIKGKEEKTFVIEGSENGHSQQPESKLTTFSRFVPERIDDYAWENDKVAFRTYGPVAQKLVEKKQPGGTLTSGMDAWLKRVSYPVINKWYKKNLDSAGYYHVEHGEGYDPYHVGDSRGIGGIGIWENDSLFVSKNFVGFKTIAIGPLRTVFELSYAPWNANGRNITEKKRISLDLGSNMSRFEINIKSDKPLPNVTVGITLHDKKGEVKIDEKQGWFRYWEPMDSSEVGLGVVLNPALVQESKDHRVETKDQSHIYVIAKPEKEKLVYYAGFGWSKSGQFKSREDWDKYLESFSKRIQSPLEIKF